MNISTDKTKQHLKLLESVPELNGKNHDLDLETGIQLVEDSKKFPLEIFPTPIKRLIKEGAETIQCPPDFIAASLLTVASALIGNKAHIEINSDWREYAVLYTAIVADPGSKKSPAIKLALEPAQTIQKKYYAEYQQRLDEIRDGQEPPKMKQIITSDATMEALSELLQENSLLMYQDELAGWIKSMDQYRRGGNDKEKWLSFWSSSPLPINRKGKEPLIIDKPFISVVGGIQPDVLQTMITRDENNNQQHDGFIDRILFAYPDAVRGVRWNGKSVSTETKEGYIQTMMRLAKLKADGTAIKIKLDPEAESEWIDFFNEHHEEVESLSFDQTLAGPYAKMEGYCARFALIIHLMRYAAGETESKDIDFYSMTAARFLTEYFKAHTKKVYGFLHADEKEKSILKAVEWMKNECDAQGLVNVREVMQSKLCGMTTKEGVMRLLNAVELAGYGHVQTMPNQRGKSSTFFVLHRNP